ncbi:MAG: hypothetical protein ABSE66_03930 [Thermoplasmata archaeon]
MVRDRRNVTPANRARHPHWLEDEAVGSRWESWRLRSPLSADVDLPKLGLLLQRIAQTPRSVVCLARAVSASMAADRVAPAATAGTEAPSRKDAFVPRLSDRHATRAPSGARVLLGATVLCDDVRERFLLASVQTRGLDR